jgi:hypothetical protein
VISNKTSNKLWLAWKVCPTVYDTGRGLANKTPVEGGIVRIRGLLRACIMIDNPYPHNNTLYSIHVILAGDIDRIWRSGNQEVHVMSGPGATSCCCSFLLFFLLCPVLLSSSILILGLSWSHHILSSKYCLSCFWWKTSPLLLGLPIEPIEEPERRLLTTALHSRCMSYNVCNGGTSCPILKIQHRLLALHDPASTMLTTQLSISGQKKSLAP